jgi:prevent-host-death family protein
LLRPSLTLIARAVCRRFIDLVGAAIDQVAPRGYFSIMRTVGLKTLKNKLSEYVRLAAAGETVAITDRGRTVAEIGPPHPQAESWRERGIREGWVRPAVRGPDWPPRGTPVPGLTIEQLMADLDKDREDRW